MEIDGDAFVCNKYSDAMVFFFLFYVLLVKVITI